MRPTRRRMASRSAVYRPAFRALPFPLGAPEPVAPPCMRQRRRPDTAGDRHAPPARVRAPHLALAIMGPTLRVSPSATIAARVLRAFYLTGVVPLAANGARLGVADGREGVGVWPRRRLQEPQAGPLGTP